MEVANTINTSFKIGVKRELVSALRKAFGNSYPDPQLANHVSVVAEYPLKEISYPMVVMHFNPGQIRNIGLGHYEIDYTNDLEPALVKRWIFDGSITLTVYALTPMDRDMVILGLLNMFAFGDQIPGFEDFWNEIRDYDFVALQINTDNITEGGDSVVSVPWDDDESPVFTDSLTIQVLGEFATLPTSGALVRINSVTVYPYQPGAPVPLGSQEHSGTSGQPGSYDNRTVGWIP
jgi:hypothetical protein